jgi:hypothetical protein
MVTWLGNLRNRSVAIRIAVLTTVVAVAYSATAPVAIHLGGSIAWAAATLAGGLCLLGAAAALAIADRLRGPNAAMAALLLGTTLRMGVPLAAGTAVHLCGGPLAQAGILWYLLVFYPITLVVGTILSLPPRNRPRTPAL